MIRCGIIRWRAVRRSRFSGLLCRPTAMVAFRRVRGRLSGLSQRPRSLCFRLRQFGGLLTGPGSHIAGPRSPTRARVGTSARSTILARVGTGALARNRVIQRSALWDRKQRVRHALWRRRWRAKLRSGSRRRGLGGAVVRQRRNDRCHALHLQLRRRLARTHRDKQIARAHASGGGHDGSEAILIGHDLRLRRTEENRHSVSPGIGAAILLASLAGTDLCQRGLKGDVHSHHRIRGARSVGRTHHKFLKSLSRQHSLRRAAHRLQRP